MYTSFNQSRIDSETHTWYFPIGYHSIVASVPFYNIIANDLSEQSISMDTCQYDPSQIIHTGQYFWNRIAWWSNTYTLI